MTLAHFIQIVTTTVTVASVVSNFLPSADTYVDYPRFKKFYETFVIGTVAAIALNIQAKYLRKDK